MGKKCQNGNGINIFEHWEVGFGKNMGWEMGLELPLQDHLMWSFTLRCNFYKNIFQDAVAIGSLLPQCTIQHFSPFFLHTPQCPSLLPEQCHLVWDSCLGS